MNVVKMPLPKTGCWDAVNLSTGDDLQLHASVDQPNPTENQSFHITCPLCQSQLHVHVDQVGKNVTCSDCDSVMEVPKPPSPKSKSQLILVDPELDLCPTEATDLPSVNAESLLSKAGEELEERERVKPVPPKRPFDDGVYTFPLRLNVLPLTGAFCLLANIIVMLAAGGVETEGLGMIIGLVLMTAAMLLAIILFVFGSVCCIAIMEETSRCVDQIKEWPPFDIVFWLWNTLFVVSTMAVSLLPCFLLNQIIPSTFLWVGPIFLFALFPIILLCEMESNSPGFPYSPLVVRSLRELPSVWMRFYLRAFVMALVLAVCCGVCCYQGYGPSILLVTVCLGAVMVIIYARLLGRLAWVIGEQLEIEEEPVEENEDPLIPKLPGTTST